MQVTRFFNSNRNRLVILVAACVFVFTQTIDLQHSHQGDLKLQADCEVCLKLGSQNDVTIAKSEAPQAAFAVVSFQSNELASFARTDHSFDPRGPPRYIS